MAAAGSASHALLTMTDRGGGLYGRPGDHHPSPTLSRLARGLGALADRAIIWLRGLPRAMGLLGRRTLGPLLTLGTAALLLLALLPAAPTAVAPLRPPAGGFVVVPAVLPATCLNTSPYLTISENRSNGSAPLPVSFSAAVQGGCPPYEVEWEFGDGGEASGTSVNHTFRGAGTFDVLASAQDQHGHSGSNRTTIHVTGGSGPVSVTISLVPETGLAPLSVTGWANVTGGNVTNPAQIAWVFGDGGSGTGSPIQHTYSMAGDYTVTATFRTSLQHASASGVVHVGSGGGMGNVTTLSLAAEPSPTSPPAAILVRAESNGVGAPFNLSVCFGDGSPCAAGPSGWNGTEELQFAHTFTTAGNYSVNGTVTNASGSVATASVVVIVLPGAPLSDVVSAVPTSGTAPLSVGFTATVSGGLPPYGIQWSFGDGSVGASLTGATVTHVFASGGSYVPHVEINDSAGHSINLTLPTITVGAPGAGFLPTSVAGVGTGYVLALLTIAAVVLGYAVGRWALARTRGERLRREGEQLVRQMEQRL